MWSIHSSTTPSRSKTIIPNLLPTTIHHTGPIPLHPRYWCPQPSTHTNKVAKKSKTETSTSYFRGRKLRGRHVVLPEGYRGVVLQKTEKVVAAENNKNKERGDAGAEAGESIVEKLRRMEEGDQVFDAEDEERMMGRREKEEEDDVRVGVVMEKGRFEEVVVWGHESVPDDEDAFVKGVEEWIGFAEGMHAYSDEAAT